VVDRELQLTSDLRQMWNLKGCLEMAKPKTVAEAPTRAPRERRQEEGAAERS